MSQDNLVASHPFLQPVASTLAQIKSEMAGVTDSSSEIPRWDDYLRDFINGVPLLRSSSVAIDCLPAEQMIRSLVERLAASPLHNPAQPDVLAIAIAQMADEIRIAQTELHGELASPHRVVAWLLGSDPFVSQSPGILRYLGWTVLSQYLRSLVDEFAKWREEYRWFRNYCPACGSPPAMAQLAGSDPGRQRFLSCGCCSTRWRYPRTKCPFCESQDEHQISILTVEGEGRLRVDYCESCRGYLKTYDGEGNEAVALADWNSIHLDVIARERGLKRLATSLYEL